jgi:uncharacterized membrane protein
MSTLIVLILSFIILWAVNTYGIKSYFSISQMGRISLAIMLLFTGTAHFYKTGEMVQMMPEFLPYKTELVYFTGVLEIIGAIGLIQQRTATVASIALILFFLAVLPANVVGSMKRVQLGGMETGPAYLYFRIPFQLLLIWWTCYFGIRLNRRSTNNISVSQTHA